MPPEPLPWDRKDFFKERKHERSSDSLGPASRWREAPHHQASSSARDFTRGGSAEYRHRPQGHGKQGGWHLFSEESNHGFTPSRSAERTVEDESCRQTGSRGDRKYGRNSGEPPSSSQKDWRVHARETGASPNGPGRAQDMSDQRSVNDMVTYNSNPNSDFINTWDQMKDQHDKTDGVNGLGTGQRFDRENSLGSIDWKPLKWTRSGSLSSRGSGFSHSSSSKSLGVDVNELKTEVQPRNVTPLQSPSGDAVACVTSAPSTEEMSSRKKPRLGWGEGLAKYEKKKVGGIDDSATKSGTVLGGTESTHSHISIMADKSPGVTGLSDCASPATPSSVGCSSSPGVEEKPFVKVAGNDNDTSNLTGSPSLVSWSHLDGLAFNLENVELTSITNLSSSLSVLLQSDDVNLVDSSYVRSTAMNKLLVLKGDISKVLEMTESEIDLLENELKSLIPDSGNGCPCPASSSSLAVGGQARPCEQLGPASFSIPRPSPLQVVSAGDMIEKAAGVLEEENEEVKDEDVDSPGTVTSKFIETTSSVKAASVSDMGKLGECSGALEQTRSRSLEMKCSVYGPNEQEKEDLSASADGTHLIASRSWVPPFTEETLHCFRDPSRLYDLIVASNNDSSSRASDVFKKLLPSTYSPRATSISCHQNDSLVKEKFAARKRFLNFKERVITLKFRAFQHLWKEDMHLLSVRKYSAKSQKKFEPSVRTGHSGHQKHRSSFRSRFSSPAGNLSLVPTTEIVNFTNKLLSDSQVKLFRNALKMPSLILDKKEKVSRYISTNGLVEDPCAVEKERTKINPWTPEEKEVFMDKLSTFGKEFTKIASFLDHKTTADCIKFYYKNHKSDCFDKTKKKQDFEKKGKSYSTNGYLVTSGKRWNREMNAASLDMLGEASAVAANGDDGGIENKVKGAARWVSGDYKTHRGDNGILEKARSLSIFGNERETVAADVLAGICGSLSSEAMSSCITSSFDPGEGYQERKCQRVGSLMRRPLTAEVSQNIGDETCSDDSCGEMDPSDWTDQEKSIFIQAVSSYGKDFTGISRCVRTRSRDQCKIFFSKARKCLGLDMVCPSPGNEDMPVREDTNGGGSDAEDACVVETGAVICSDNSGCKLDEDMLSDLTMNRESDPVGTLKTGMKTLHEDDKKEDPDSKDAVNVVVDDCQLEVKQQLDFYGDGNTETAAEDNHVSVQPHVIALLPSDTAAGQEGNNLKQSVSVDEGNDQSLSICAELSNEVIVEVSAEPLGTETEGKQVMPMQGDYSDANARCGVLGSDCTFQDSSTTENTSHHASDISSSSGLTVCPKHEPETLELVSTQNAHLISAQSDNSLFTLNSTAQDSAADQNETTLNQDPSTTLDPQKMQDEQDQKSSSVNDYSLPQFVSGGSLPENAESSQIVRDYPVSVKEEMNSTQIVRDFPVSVKKEMNGDISSEKPASFQSLPKNFHSAHYLSQECYLQKCNNSKAHSSVAELPSQEQTKNHSRSNSQSSSDVEKPCRNGDVKLFGQILTHPSSQQKQNPGTHENDDKVNQHSKLSSKSITPKLSGTRSADGNFVPTRFDRNNYLGLENLPMRSYGFWDGNRIQTGLSSLPDSAILLAKYPAAFGNYPTTSSKMDQPLHSVVKSTECNVNGASVFPRREISSNGMADYQVYRNRDVTKAQPFAVDMKQRQDLFSEMQRRNGFDSVSSIQQQSRGMVGINVVGRGGIVVGGPCTGVSDPVAAIKLHYAKTEQYSGQAGGGIISEEDSWRGKGDIGR